jgi:hypothetical protein
MRLTYARGLSSKPDLHRIRVSAVVGSYEDEPEAVNKTTEHKH